MADEPIDDAIEVPDVMEQIIDWDPVHRDRRNGKWYFWQETWAHRSGPFKSEAEARAALDDYCANELGHVET